MLKASFFLALGLIPVILLPGQVRPVTETPIAAPAATTSLPDHPIIPNDLISVAVFDEPELSKTARVSADGTFLVPQLKDPIKVQGLLPHDVEAEISRALLAQNILVHPEVSVAILEYATKMVSVVGDVKIPGQFPITGPITLYEALAKAGWIDSDGGSDILLTTSPTRPPRRINLTALQDGTDPTVNVELTGGEVVNVPDAPKVWVTGNVIHPEPVPIRTPGDATVLKVVASAQGLAQYYNKYAYIYRANKTGSRTEIKIPLFAIMHRKAPDVALVSDDILLIPDDNGTKRRDLLQILQTMAGAGASAGTLLGVERVP